MSEHVAWVLQVDVKPDQLEALRALMEEMVDATKANERGTLNYEWHVSDDGSICHIYERYVDSSAVMTHMATVGAKYTDRFMAAVTPSAFFVYGTPNEEVREALSGIGARFLKPLGGFAR